MTAILVTAIPPEVRSLVLARDDWRCACCWSLARGREHGLWPRLLPGDGGRMVAENLVTLLAACRDRMAGDEAGEMGYRLAPGQDPLLVPVMYAAGLERRQYYLTSGGERVATLAGGAS